MDNSLKLVMFLYILTCISIVFNIAVLRQVFGFIYLSFVPGYLFLKILKPGEGDLLETVVFSTGLSIAFLMFLGLLLNEIFPTFKLSRPLSTVPLMIALSGLTLILFLSSYRQKDKETKSFSLGKANMATVLQLCLLFVLPILSIVGASYHNTSFLLLMIFGIAVLCAASILSDQLIPEKIFPLAIASASIALLLHTALISKHLIGCDIFLEFYTFRTVEIGGFWHALGPVMSYSLIDSLNSILSITVLPTIYTGILRIDGEVFFKLFYPLVFSLIPLTLYKMYEQQTGKKVALLSVFFFISTPITFYGLEPINLSRQSVGQFFFILSMFLIIENKLSLRKKRILLVIFGAALIVSHYSIAYIFLFYILSLFVLSRIRFLSHRRIATQTINLGIVLLLIALTFSWYIYVSDSPLNQMLNSFQRIISWFGTDMFSAEARGFEGAASSLSPFATTSLIGMVHKALIYLEHFFIGIGIIVIVVEPKQFRFNPDFRLVTIVSTVILLMCMGIPNLSHTLDLTRFYAITIPFLAVFFALGGTFLIRFIGKFPVKNLGLYMVTCVLIASFLFQVGFVNHITGGYPYSYPLDIDTRVKSSNLDIRAATHSTYFLDQEVLGAKWLLENVNPLSKVYADRNSQVTVLKSYALLPDDRMLTITENFSPAPGACVYLKYLNVRIGVISTAGLYLNTSDISPVLGNCNKIYSNGDSDIYYTP